MGYIISTFLALILASFAGKLVPTHISGRGLVVGSLRTVAIFAAIGFTAATSIIYVGPDEVGVLNKKFGGSNLENGQIIATKGEKGYQAKIIAPGTHVMFLVTVINAFETLPVVTIPEGYYGIVEARDGKPLPSGAIMAPEWGDSEKQKMLGAEYFLTSGKGFKGPQLSVLKPGKHRLNLYQYKVKYSNGTDTVVYDSDGRRTITGGVGKTGKEDTKVLHINVGEVGVVRSNVLSNYDTAVLSCKESTTSVSDMEGALSVPLVPTGCKGVWDTPLNPGAHYMNTLAFQITPMSTRVQTWKYGGGYKKRTINLTISEEKGTIEQHIETENIPFRKDEYADRAVFPKTEKGWEVPLELRAIVQISPKNAPIVVAAVGGLREVEDKILTPAIRSIGRNIFGYKIVIGQDKDGNDIRRSIEVMDLISHREQIENLLETLIRVEGLKAGIDIKEVRLGEPAIPPELLVTQRIIEISQKMKKAAIEKREWQIERQKTEEARATADEQGRLVAAQIDADRAEKFAEQQEHKGLGEQKLAKGRAAALKFEGEGERDKLLAIAKGRAALVKVLGQDRTMALEQLKMTLSFLSENPEMLNAVEKFVPETLIITGGGVGGSAGIPGANTNLVDAMAVFGTLTKPRAITVEPANKAKK